MSYEEFFRSVCGFTPYPFQIRFHEADANLTVLEVPTGLGKTNTVIIDWLKRRSTKRLVYCLPGRALTQQVADVARNIVGNNVRVVELMGGSEDLDEKIGPDQRAIIVGTQDVLVSRALNRGYAETPFRWPMDFGLLNNDVTWVFDEVQLLGEVVATSAQMAAFRKEMGTFGRVRCVWMTATFERPWLNTVDFHDDPVVIHLQDDDLSVNDIQKRVRAAKSIQETKACDTPRECAAFIQGQHRENELTLVIANTVARAQEIWDELGKLKVQAELLHSRFRACDRVGALEKALTMTRGIIVSTQVIEAGVDLDAHLMITDSAPWSSLVQRFGRVNRRGEHNQARVFWVRNPQRQKGKPKTDGTQFKPYEKDEVERAVGVLDQLSSAAPGDLSRDVKAPLPYKFVLRRSDLLDLFDTTPDLAGNQIDVSRFVRSGEETSVYLAWRSWAKEELPPRLRFFREELCPVPHFPGGNKDVRDLLKKHGGWAWNYAKRGNWQKIDDPDHVYAGMRILLRSEAGGYEPKRGWAPESKAHVPQFAPPRDAREEESMNSDRWSETRPQSLEEHTEEVVKELHSLLEDSVRLNGTRSALERAANFHDWGKAHPVFQQTLYDLPEPPEAAPNPLLAKQERKLSRKKGHSREWFRHELGSALAMWHSGEEFLAVYLAAAHHGKVRLSIRSMPGEVILDARHARIARGMEEGDVLFAAKLGPGFDVPSIVLDLTPTELGTQNGQAGWSERALDLLDEQGPFRLAYLELLLRTADERASAKADEGAR